MIEPNMGNTRFDRCILLAKLPPRALDWPSFLREWHRPEFFFLAGLRQRSRCLAIRSGTLQRVFVPSCNSSTWSSSNNKQQKKQAAAASPSSKTSPADMAHAAMAPCRRKPTWHPAVSFVSPQPPSGQQRSLSSTETTKVQPSQGVVAVKIRNVAAYSVLILQVLLLLLLLLLLVLLLLRALLQASVTR